MLLRGLPVLSVQLFQKNYQHPEAHAHTHADIRKIEHRKLHEQQIDVVHYLAVEHTVDQVADAAGKDQQQRSCCRYLPRLRKNSP